MFVCLSLCGCVYVYVCGYVYVCVCEVCMCLYVCLCVSTWMGVHCHRGPKLQALLGMESQVVVSLHMTLV